MTWVAIPLWFAWVMFVMQMMAALYNVLVKDATSAFFGALMSSVWLYFICR